MKQILLLITILLLSGCSYFDPNPPEGKTAGYVHEPISTGREIASSEDESASSSQAETETAPEEETIITGMAIFRPATEKLLYLTREEVETLTYSETDIASWNATAAEYGLAPFAGTTDLEFEQFIASVRLAIENANAAAAEEVYEEPVYEEPVYEEPVYEEPVYEEPDYEDPNSVITDPLPDESGTEVPSDFNSDTSDSY